MRTTVALGLWTKLWPIALTAVCAAALVGEADARGTVTACAIRWDAYYTDAPDGPAAWTARALGKPEWRSRTPLHAQFDASGHIRWSPSQQTFDAEIRAAKQANLCWAYLAYGDHEIDLDHPMMRGLRFHRASTLRSDVPYALILQARVLGRPGDYKIAESKILDLLADSFYERVEINGETRPVLFFMHEETTSTSSAVWHEDDLKSCFDDIRERSREAGLGNPYLIVMAWSGKQAEAIRNAVGGDGVSRYFAGHWSGKAMPWQTFEATVEADWNSYAAATRADSIPALSTGGDVRAMCQTPAPWDRRFSSSSKCDSYADLPSLGDLKTEFGGAIDWVTHHNARDPSNLLVVYSWSECVEGGNCLMPTYGDPSGEKIRAIEDVIGH